MSYEDTAAVKPCGGRGPATAEEAFSWLKWYEEQSCLLAQSSLASDSVYHLNHMAELIPVYRLLFPERRVEFALIGARVQRIRGW